MPNQKIGEAVRDWATLVAGTDGTSSRRLRLTTDGDIKIGAGSAAIGTVDTELPAAAAASDTIANPTTTNVMAMLMGWNGSTWSRVPTQAAIGDAVAANYPIAASNYVYNGTTFDRLRGSISGTSNAQTANSVATVTGSDIVNYNGKALRLIITFADKQGTVDFTPKVQGKTAGGTYYDIWTAAAAVSANSVVVYDISPYAVSTATGVTESKIAIVPRTFRVVLTYNGAGAGNSFDILGEYELTV